MVWVGLGFIAGCVLLWAAARLDRRRSVDTTPVGPAPSVADRYRYDFDLWETEFDGTNPRHQHRVD